MWEFDPRDQIALHFTKLVDYVVQDGWSREQFIQTARWFYKQAARHAKEEQKEAAKRVIRLVSFSPEGPKEVSE